MGLCKGGTDNFSSESRWDGCLETTFNCECFYSGNDYHCVYESLPIIMRHVTRICFIWLIAAFAYSIVLGSLDEYTTSYGQCEYKSSLLNYIYDIASLCMFGISLICVLIYIIPCLPIFEGRRTMTIFLTFFGFVP